MATRSRGERGDGPLAEGDAGEQTEASVRTLREHGQEMRAEGEAFLHATQSLLSDLNQVVGHQLDARPYATLGTAFGFGLLLGGGLPFPLVRFAARAAAGIFLRQAVEAALPFGPSRA